VRPTGLGQLASWAKETDLPAGSGFQQAGGTWSVELATAPSERDALSLYGELRTLGYATQIFPVGPVGQRSYAVRIVNLPSEAEAQALINHLPVPELLSPRILH
jgi:hypothetical protein